MSRQDVPYGGAICRLKERIAEIWDKLGEKLHSVNGVTGDAAGDVKIVSGDAAVVVTSDQVNHKIEIALDSSQLPAAAVSSVNGQTGAVVLDGNDIETFEGSGVNVTDAIVTNVGQLNNLQGRLNQEISDRQAGDNALQGSINSVQASIPGAAATAVANDPTVAQLATDVPNKVDKITSGSSLKAYTHTGATQGETSVVDGTAANSIGIRDANGRMQAADPASGATDKTLVTANWVSQTGNSAPNNLMHRRGNESIFGVKDFEYIHTNYNNVNRFSVTAQNGKYWVKIYEFDNSGEFAVPMFGFTALTRESGDVIIACAEMTVNAGVVRSVQIKGFVTDPNLKPKIAISAESVAKFTVWFNLDSYFINGLRSNTFGSYTSNYESELVTPMNPNGGTQQAYDMDSTGYTDENNVRHNFVKYATMS